MEGRIEQVLVKHSTRVGLWSDRVPTWAWYLGSSDKLQWICSPLPLPGKLPGDPPWFASDVTGKLMQGIEVLLIQGSWPAKSSLLWKIPSLKVVLRVGPDKDRRAKQRAPAGWSVKCTRLKHEQLGGVTTGEFRSYVAIPPGEELLAMQTSQGLNNTLGQIISPMEKCFTWVNEPDQGAVNTGKGLLKWTERFAPVVTPSVFKPNAWGLRKLTVHELASALDFPSTRTDAMTDPEVLRKLTKSEMPGKIWVAGLEYLRTWNRHSATTRKVCGFQSDSGLSTSGFGVPISDFSSSSLRMNRGSKRIRGDEPEIQSAKRNCARDISYVSSEDEMVEEVENEPIDRT